jgi:hypothetical protein
MGKSYKDKYKRNSSFDKRSKRIKQGKSKFKFSVEDAGKKPAWDDEQE